ncbi:MAG: hypothetical protein C4582_13595 [Desulfobacteraceae bacterium]|nr:MAG: hypothetical protein C4582_13595 [Desulfobacteraceae bacterium]
MIIEGLKLTIIGMSIVFAFLLFLIFVIKITAAVLKKSTRKEEELFNFKKIPITNGKAQEENNTKLLAVISASITAHRLKNRIISKNT